jgi:hypothetical protein
VVPVVDEKYRAVVIVGLGVILWLSGAGAAGAIEHPSIEASATGARGILSSFHPLAGTAPPVLRAFFEVSENLLYGIPSLHSPGSRAGVRIANVALTVEAAQLVSDVGYQNRLALVPAFFAGERWSASAGLVYECVNVRGFPPARTYSLTVRSRARLTGSVSVGGEVKGYRLAGEALNGSDATVALLIRPVNAAVIRAVFEFDRTAGLYPTFSTTLLAPASLRLTLGYGATTESLRCALGAELQGVACVAGVDWHPVLGLRRGITLSWRR